MKSTINLNLNKEIEENDLENSFERYATFKTTKPTNFEAKATPKDKMQRLDKVKAELAKDLKAME